MKANKYGQIVAFTPEIGEMEKLTERESWSMRTAISTKECGPTIRLMAMVSTLTQMEPVMLVSGFKTSSMEQE